MCTRNAGHQTVLRAHEVFVELPGFILGQAHTLHDCLRESRPPHKGIVRWLRARRSRHAGAPRHFFGMLHVLLQSRKTKIPTERGKGQSPGHKPLLRSRLCWGTHKRLLCKACHIIISMGGLPLDDGGTMICGKVFRSSLGFIEDDWQRLHWRVQPSSLEDSTLKCLSRTLRSDFAVDLRILQDVRKDYRHDKA